MSGVLAIAISYIVEHVHSSAVCRNKSIDSIFFVTRIYYLCQYSEYNDQEDR